MSLEVKFYQRIVLDDIRLIAVGIMIVIATTVLAVLITGIGTVLLRSILVGGFRYLWQFGQCFGSHGTGLKAGDHQHHQP